MHPTLRRLATLLVALVLVGTGAAQRTLTVAQTVDIPGFDPHDHGLTAVEAVLTNIFDYLLFRDADGTIQPALATGYEQVDDLTWRFTLRDDVVWHDGEPFTGADVKFSFERVAQDDTLFEHDSFRQITEVEVVGPHEILIRTAGPDPVLLSRISRKGAAIVPAHVIEEIGWEGFSVAPVGTGPFRFVEWTRDDRVVFEANPEHWRGAPAWDRLVFRAVPEDATRIGELLTGAVDIAVNVPSQDVERIRDAVGVAVLSQPTTRIMMLLFNTADGKPTSDPRVREALELAIDKELLVEVVADGFGVPVGARVSPGVNAAPMKYYDQNAYDPERAVALLAEAGYGPGELTVAL
jgi:peptide/nickel transport system substrate-binding protein